MKLTASSVIIKLAAAETVMGDQPPELGAIIYEIFDVMNKKFNAIPPNLTMSQSTNQGVIEASDPTTGMNVKITIQDSSVAPQTGPVLTPNIQAPAAAPLPNQQIPPH